MQLGLPYSASHVGRELHEKRLAWVRRVIDLVGHKTAAGELDVAPSTLTDALLERERKSVKLEWESTLLAICGDAMRDEWTRMMSGVLGYETPQRIRTRTAEERLAEVERVIKERLGSIGEQLLAEVRR